MKCDVFNDSIVSSSNRLPFCFAIVNELSFEAIQANEFLSEREQLTGTGHPSALEVFKSPSLVLHLECAACGHGFPVDYYSYPLDEPRRCPKCEMNYRLAGGDVLIAFIKQLRGILVEADEADPLVMASLGQTIAKAAILLEPLCLVFVVGFSTMNDSQFLGNTAVFLKLMKRFQRLPSLFIAFPPDTSNHYSRYILKLWRRSGFFIITPAALTAFNVLKTLKGNSLDNPYIYWPTSLWTLVRHNGNGSSFTISPSSDRPKERHARHLIDLREYFWAADSLSLVPGETDEHLLGFTPKDDGQAASWLERQGIKADYVTFAGRDEVAMEKRYIDGDWRYFRFRNMDVETFMPAMSWLESVGLPSVRVGDGQEKKLPPGFADTVSHDCSECRDFLKTYLPSKSLFSVTIPQGIDHVAYIMNKPLLIINATTLGSLMIMRNNENTFLLPKKLWSEREGKFLSLGDIFHRGYGDRYNADLYQEHGIVVIDNTEEEIADAVKEIYARFVTRNWTVTRDEQLLQGKWVDFFNRVYPGFSCKSRLVYSFFYNNSYLLYDA